MTAQLGWALCGERAHAATRLGHGSRAMELLAFSGAHHGMRYTV